MTFNILLYATRILAFVIAIPFHEAAHAFVSYKLGDPTAKNNGRLTLNPLKHFDLMGMIAMLIIGVGWAKPVPIDVRYYRNRKKGMALTALAGPVSNLLLAFVFYALQKLVFYIWCILNPAFAAYGIGYYIAFLASESPFLYVNYVLKILALININLAVFNLIPLPPFDGSRVLGLILPEKAYFNIQKYERYMMFGFLALIFIVPRVFNVNPLGSFLMAANGFVEKILDKLTFFIDLIFMNFL